MRVRDRRGDERGKLSIEKEEKVKMVMKSREREGEKMKMRQGYSKTEKR